MSLPLGEASSVAVEHDQDTQTNEHINAYRWHDCKVIYRSISCAFVGQFYSFIPTGQC